MMSGDLWRALSTARDCAPGVSAKDEIWRSGKLKLYRYRSIAKPAREVPLLVVYALVNRPYMMDLEERRSLIRGLLSRGIDVYLIDWGYPDGADRHLSLEDYLEKLVLECVDRILEIHRMPSLDILGVCQGGVLSLCFSALHPERVRNLITMVTPVDFHTPADLLSKWVRKIDVRAWVGDGNVPGEALNGLFLSLMPFRLTQQKYLELARGPADPARIENFMRVEHWIFDSPDQAGTAFCEFVSWFYQENRLVRGGLEIGGRRVELRSLELPMLNLIGRKDHLVPPASSAALQRLVATKDFTSLEFDLGHIGMYVSERAQREVPPAITEWLTAR
jgi:polyhydroxyalkanoate synthase subunit PhaC